MHVSRLHLEEFRSYQQLDLAIPASGMRLIGKNGSGKTSFLEAIVLLATTRSARTSSDRELVGWTSGEAYGLAPWSRVEADVQTDERAHRIAIALELDAAHESVTRKTFTLDGQAARGQDLIGVLKFVLFSPEDVQLVTGPPAERRRQLDVLISQIDREYLRALTRYNRVLPQRNGLLKAFARDRVSPMARAAIAEIAFWDEELVAAGAYVVASRRLMIDRLSELMAARSGALIEGANLGLAYEARLDFGSITTADNRHTIRSLNEALVGRFHDQLADVRAEEFRRGMTVIGPHRDDLTFRINGRSLATYGSRGQQRLGVVAIKLSEGDLIAAETGETPVLLLDDVLSELDEVHRDHLLQAVAVPGRQLLVSSTEPGPLEHPALGSLPILEIVNGTIQGG
ncbi:MAG TPA: DNA replication/repair protein RecF [Thermomicrobiales bacterium]|nr:DNA replication/repair protein RecF [Thermomicrobiales bacterium]